MAGTSLRIDPTRLAHVASVREVNVAALDRTNEAMRKLVNERIAVSQTIIHLTDSRPVTIGGGEQKHAELKMLEDRRDRLVAEIAELKTVQQEQEVRQREAVELFESCERFVGARA